MTAHAIADRPDLDQQINTFPLLVSGSLPKAVPVQDYEGRLQIKNAIGACSARQFGGDTLPVGHSIYVDNATNEVVIAWPAYTLSAALLQNPGFESGNVGGWEFDFIGGDGTPAIDSAQRFEGQNSLRFTGARGLGSEGGVECKVINNTIGKVYPTQYVSGSIRGMYNPGGHNFGCRYQARLIWLDADDGTGDVIGESLGPVFKGRGLNGQWIEAPVTAVTPAGAAGVRLAGWLASKGPPTWMDSAEWDVPTSVGINYEVTFSLTIEVKDSAGRVAYWTGQIVVTYWDFTWGATVSGALASNIVEARIGFIAQQGTNVRRVNAATGTADVHDAGFVGVTGTGYEPVNDRYYYFAGTSTATVRLLRADGPAGAFSVVGTYGSSAHAVFLLPAFDVPGDMIGIGRTSSLANTFYGRCVSGNTLTNSDNPLMVADTAARQSDFRMALRQERVPSYWAIASSNNPDAYRFARAYNGRTDWRWIPLPAVVGSASGSWASEFAISEDMDVIVIAATGLAAAATHQLLRVTNIHDPNPANIVFQQVALPGTLPGAGDYHVVWHKARREFIAMANGRATVIGRSTDGQTWTQQASDRGAGFSSPDQACYSSYHDVIGVCTQTGGIRISN